MSEKDSLLQTWDREFRTTLRVMKEFPQEKIDLRPSEKSRTARELLWVFVMEEGVADGVLKGEIDFGPEPPPPSTVKEIAEVYERNHREVFTKAKAVPEADLNKTVKFMVAPKQLADLRRADVLWTVVMDNVHHRGQLTVYLRMAGAKVPSIYGPTADEPWW